jgi:hypothetical protein
VGRIDRLVLSIAALAIGACGPGGFRVLDTGKQVSLRGVYVMGRNKIVAAGEQGTVLFSDGTRATDTSTDAGMPLRVPEYYGVVETDEETTVCGDRGIARALRAGHWTADDSGTSNRILTMFRPTPTLIYGAGEGGTVIRRPVGTSHWQSIDVHAPADAKITGSWAISPTAIALATDKGVIIESSDKGGWTSQTVTTNTSSTPLPLFAVWSSTKGADLVAVGLGGSIFRRRAGESTWQQEKSGVTQDLYGVFGTKNDQVYAVGARGTILLYDGTGWNGVTSGTSNDLFGIHGLADGSYYAAVGTLGTILVFDNR